MKDSAGQVLFHLYCSFPDHFNAVGKKKLSKGSKSNFNKKSKGSFGTKRRSVLKFKSMLSVINQAIDIHLLPSIR